MLRSFCLSTLVLAGVVSAFNGSVTDYAPLVNQPCPNITTDPLLRSFTPKNQSLHPREEEYVATRQTTVIPDAWRDWIGDGSAIGYNLSALSGGNGTTANATENFPKLAIAISGGGYRAAQYGAGVLSALDARNDSSKAAGTGGLLQVMSYLAGLSGGSWLTGSLYMNDFPTITDLVHGNGGNLSGWLLDIPLATPDGPNLFSQKNQDWYGSLLWSVYAKGNMGIDTSLTDPWARMLAYHFLNQTNLGNFFMNDSAHGAGQLWSDVPLIPSWQQHLVPFPIIQVDSLPIGSNSTSRLVDPSSVVYEMTPMEFGSFDPQLSAMVNLSYAGTHLTNGQPDNDTACTTQFDQTGFIIGTSASLFNQIIDVVHNTIEGLDDSSAKSLLLLLNRQLAELHTRADDVANWPNPFYSLGEKANFQDTNSKWLDLIDGSSNAENVPLGQLLVKARGLDVVVAVDASSNTATLWPNGSSVFRSSARVTNLLQSSHQTFPPIPGSLAQFISTGVNMRPTFYGCFPTQNPPEYPIVIHLPNSPPINGDNPVTNTKTFRLDYTPLHTRLFLDQVHANTIGGFVPNTNSPDPNFGKCLQCIAIDRARYNVNPPAARSSFCMQCLQQYCFDPNNLTSASALPGRKFDFVDPDPQGLSAVTGFLGREKVALILGFIFLALVIAGISTYLILRKRRRAREGAYQNAMDLHDDDDDDVDVDEPPFMHHNQYRDSTDAEMQPLQPEHNPDTPTPNVEEEHKT